MAFAEPPGWYVISLRPRGEHAPMRRAAARQGARLLALSPWRLALHDDPATRRALGLALAAPRVLFTSPAAVRAAAALQVLRSSPGQSIIAVGAGTAQALRQAGVDAVESPSRMDSEGVLGLPGLLSVAGMEVGLVTAPQGRDLLAATLRQRGAVVRRADVYRRVPVPLSAAALRKLRELQRPAALALSSGGALQQLLASLPPDAAARLRAMPVVAASARLQQLALDSGFARVSQAEGPLPGQILAAMARCFR